MSEHFCHAKDCKIVVPPKRLMCKRHWFMVPPDLRTEVWREYRPGQEADKEPTAAYLEAARKAIVAVQATEEIRSKSGSRSHRRD
jgi:hypothetical protein